VALSFAASGAAKAASAACLQAYAPVKRDVEAAKTPGSGATIEQVRDLAARLRAVFNGVCADVPQRAQGLALADQLDQAAERSLAKARAQAQQASQPAPAAPPPAPTSAYMPNQPPPPRDANGRVIDAAYLAGMHRCNDDAQAVLAESQQPGATPQSVMAMSVRLHAVANGVCAGFPTQTSLNQTADQFAQMARNAGAQAAPAPQPTASAAAAPQRVVTPGCTGAIDLLVSDSQQPGVMAYQAGARHFAARYRQVADGPCATDPRRSGLQARAASLDASAAQLPATMTPPPAPKTTTATVERHGPSLAAQEGALRQQQAERELREAEAKIRAEREKRAKEEAARQARREEEARQRVEAQRKADEPHRVLSDLLKAKELQLNREIEFTAAEVASPTAVTAEINPAHVMPSVAVLHLINHTRAPLKVTVQWEIRWSDGWIDKPTETVIVGANWTYDLSATRVGVKSWTARTLSMHWVDSRIPH